MATRTAIFAGRTARAAADERSQLDSWLLDVAMFAARQRLPRLDTARLFTYPVPGTPYNSQKAHGGPSHRIGLALKGCGMCIGVALVIVFALIRHRG